MTQHALRDIKPNPFRHMERYPISRQKIEELLSSFRQTGFWDNLVGRSRNGSLEIAYGHHRLTALKEEYGPDFKVNLILRDLDDEAMLKIMAAENMETWGTFASVEHETVRAVVEAYAKDFIKLKSVGLSSRAVRYAPSFLQGDDTAGREHPYNAQTVAEFLGWVYKDGTARVKVHDALAALALVEDGTLADEDFVGLPSAASKAVTQQALTARTQLDQQMKHHKSEAERSRLKAEQDEKNGNAESAKAAKLRAKSEMKQCYAKEKEKQTLPTAIGEKLSGLLKNNSILPKDASRIRMEMMPPSEVPNTKVSNASDVFGKVESIVRDCFRPDLDEKLEGKLQFLLEIKDDSNASGFERSVNEFAQSLYELADRATQWASAFKQRAELEKEVPAKKLLLNGSKARRTPA